MLASPGTPGRAEGDESPAELERFGIEIAGQSVIRGKAIGIGCWILAQIVPDDPAGNLDRLGIGQVGQKGIACAVLVEGQQFRFLFSQGLGSNDRPDAAVAGGGKHGFGIHLVSQFPATLLGRQVRQSVQPPVAHHEVGLFHDLLLEHPDRLLLRHNLAKVARHEPAHAQAAEKIVDGILGAVIGAVVISGQEQAVPFADDQETFVAAPGAQARRDPHAQRVT